MPKFGIIGAATCTAMAFIVGNGILMNWYYLKIIKLDIKAFWKNIIKISIVPIIMIIIGNIILKYVVVKNLWILMLLGIIYVIIFGIFSWIFEMNNYEKSLLIGAINRIKK